MDGNANLEGSLSGDIVGMSFLTAIRLGQTRIGGTIPEEIFFLPELEEMDFSGAAFTGTLSESFQLLANSLRRVKLADNSFVGSIPEAFDSLTSLSKLMICFDPSFHSSGLNLPHIVIFSFLLTRCPPIAGKCTARDHL